MNKMISRISTTIVIIFIAFLPGRSYSQTKTEVCRDIENAINHPAQFATEKARKSFSSLKCLAVPHCCGPTWHGHPECYVVNNKKISDAWTEVTKTRNCVEKSVRDGISEFATNRLDPTFVFTEPLYIAYESYRAVVSASGSQIPERYQRALLSLIDADPQGYPFNADHIVNTTWQTESNDLAKPLSPSFWGSEEHGAITHDDLIIVKGALLNLPFCEQLGRLWAHELVHVAQYENTGGFQFLSSYVAESRTVPYREISYEKVAYDVEAKAIKYCESNELEKPTKITEEKLSVQIFTAYHSSRYSGFRGPHCGFPEENSNTICQPTTERIAEFRVQAGNSTGDSKITKSFKEIDGLSGAECIVVTTVINPRYELDAAGIPVCMGPTPNITYNVYTKLISK